MKLKSKKIIRIIGIGIGCFFLATISVMYVGAKVRLFGSAFNRETDWTLGLQEPSFNFDEVIPGKLYRSENPDEKFIQYVHEKYRVQHIISLTGDETPHEYARKLGINVIVYRWSTHHLPPREEISKVVDFIYNNDGVLVHCGAGSDRTGYAVAFYRIWRQNWSLEKAIEEMEKFGHHPEKKAALHQEMKELYNNTGI